jgi:hypothetical protein
MVDNGSILVTGAAGQLGSVGRTVTGLLLDRGFPVRAMVRRDDERAASLRAAGAHVVVGDLLEPGDVYRAVSGLQPGLLRHVRFRRVPRGGRDHGGRGAGSRSERVGQHVPDDSLRDEHPEHHPEPSAAAALVERAGARVVGPACRYHPADNVPGELSAISRPERPRPGPH